MNFLAISGSLRQLSYNSAALHALKMLAPSHTRIHIFNKLNDIPLFNPDSENDVIPALEELRILLSDADGLILASPEYAHGISGVMKNTLDWLVSGVEFINKPIMLINTSPRAHHALDSLREVITTMSGNIIENACITIPLLGSNLNAEEIVARDELATLLKSGLDNFCEEINL